MSTSGTQTVVSELKIRTKPLGQVSLSEIREDKDNPRVRFEGIADLVASVKSLGVVSPVMVRALPQAEDGVKFQLIYGARRVRAAHEAGISSVPTVLAECTDDEAAAIQLVENGQREGVHPIDEAKAIRRLLAASDNDNNEAVTAARLGRSVAYLRRRLELLLLPEEAQKEFRAGRVALGVAHLIAGLPRESDRKTVWDGLKQDAALLVDLDEAREEIRNRVMPDLASAAFPLNDAVLVAAAGACLTCPKRTTAQADLFGESKGAGACLDSKCFSGKQRAYFDLQAKQAKAEGIPVMSKKEQSEVFRFGNRPDRDYVRADDTFYSTATNRSQKYSAVMADAKDKRVLAQDGDGNPVILYRKKDAEAKAKAAAATSRPKVTPAAQRAKELAKHSEERRERQRSELVAMLYSAAGNVTPEKFLELLYNARVAAQIDETGGSWASSPFGKFLKARGEKTLTGYTQKTGFPPVREILVHEIAGDLEDWDNGDLAVESLLEGLGIKATEVCEAAGKVFDRERKESAPVQKKVKKTAKAKPKAKRKAVRSAPTAAAKEQGTITS